MKSVEALEEIKRGKFITSEMFYGYFYMSPGYTSVIYYVCTDSGCNACKNEYTIGEFLNLDCEFEIL